MTVEQELAEALAELNRERRVLLSSERAESEGRVTDRGIWRNTMRRRRERVAELERIVAALTGPEAA